MAWITTRRSPRKASVAIAGVFGPQAPLAATVPGRECGPCFEGLRGRLAGARE